MFPTMSSLFGKRLPYKRQRIGKRDTPVSQCGERQVRRREMSTLALRTGLVRAQSKQLRADLLLLLLTQLQLRQISGQCLDVGLGQLPSDTDHD